MTSYQIKEVTPKYTYVVFTNDAGATLGKMFNGAPTEAEIMEEGESLLPDTSPPTLAALKEAKVSDINFWRQVALDGGFTFMGHMIDSDPTTRANIIGEALAAQMGEAWPQGYVWRAQDNALIPMTGTDVQNMARALRVFTLTLYQRSWALKAAVDAAQTVDELNLVPVK